MCGDGSVQPAGPWADRETVSTHPTAAAWMARLGTRPSNGRCATRSRGPQEFIVIPPSRPANKLSADQCIPVTTARRLQNPFCPASHYSPQTAVQCALTRRLTPRPVPHTSYHWSASSHNDRSAYRGRRPTRSLTRPADSSPLAHHDSARAYTPSWSLRRGAQAVPESCGYQGLHRFEYSP